VKNDASPVVLLLDEPGHRLHNHAAKATAALVL